MAVLASEILFKHSGGSSPGNSTAQTNGNLSLGGYMASSQLTAATLNNLFDDVTGAENAASDVEYRCFFIHQSNATDTASTINIWLFSETAGGASAAIALDSTGNVAYNTASTMALTVANENTAPAGPLTFNTSTTEAGGLTIASMGPNTARGIWVRRSAANTASLALDGVVIRVAFDSV